jgi:hypothetical protein
VGLWQYKVWGWSLAFYANAFSLALLIFTKVTHPRTNILLLALLYFTGLAVLLFSPVRGCLGTAPRSHLLSWWEGGRDVDRGLITAIGIAQILISSLILLAMLPYALLLSVLLLYPLAGILAGVMLVKGSLPARIFTLGWCLLPLVALFQFTATDPIRHSNVGQYPTQFLAAYCTAVGFYLAFTIIKPGEPR